MPTWYLYVVFVFEFDSYNNEKRGIWISILLVKEINQCHYATKLLTFMKKNYDLEETQPTSLSGHK